MWLIYAFTGPVLWAVSTHIDKYSVDRYFRHSDTSVLMLFTALLGVVALPLIWAFDPQVLKPGWQSIVVMTGSGVLYMGAMLFYLRAIQTEEAPRLWRSCSSQYAVHLSVGLVLSARKAGFGADTGYGAGGGRGAGPVAGQAAVSGPLRDAPGVADAAATSRWRCPVCCSNFSPCGMNSGPPPLDICRRSVRIRCCVSAAAGTPSSP